ncbi:hypothetical protein KUV95_07225 [Microbulbifer agarilyticus]|uniref:hypothetical protein n=1 Tax=Microbulbifer agarilyticus TaxID=260552 RepID=UPI001C957EA8|nr:hypothetical protein [Microbulbifer agarilyticus]MBY6211340.1 hypothetical protein [Microbulbifer agarilyticus]
MFRSLINAIGTHLVPFTNPRVVCPPGIIPKSSGKPIIVASVMRSGTHLAIDLLLNNFPELAKKPLYVDADQLFRNRVNREKYINNELKIGRCVVKTHFPQAAPEDMRATIEKLVKESHVILLRRPVEQTLRSTQSWGLVNDVDLYKEKVDNFFEYWSGVSNDVLEVNFDELTDREKFPSIVHNVSKLTGLKSTSKTRYPVNPKKIVTMIATKLATRLFGKRAPVINTGIRSGMTQH